MSASGDPTPGMIDVEHYPAPAPAKNEKEVADMAIDSTLGVDKKRFWEY